MISVGELKAGLKGAQDLLAAFGDRFQDMSEDEKVFADAFALAEIVDPALIPFAAVAPVFEFALAWIVANNTQGRPGSQTPMHASGARGGASAGGRIDEDDGA